MYDTILSSSKLSVGYGKKVVASGLEFEVARGEILTIIGPNGAGKSTILKSVAAQLPLVSGSVTVAGADLASIAPNDLARKLSICLTDRISAEKTTCEDVVSTGRYPYTGRLGILSGDDRKIVREAMELTGAAAYADEDIRRISDGQRQTVMLARAVAQQPEILVLDEPTSFLDVNNKLRLLGILRDLARNGNIAVIQTLHELDLAQRFSDKILCVKNGAADRFGTPEEIFSGDYIAKLYDIENGSFLPVFGTTEAAKAEGEPKAFVIAGGGGGIDIYRRLQRMGTPFAAGIIHENDVEHPVAKALAAELFTEKAFEPISDENVRRALETMNKCEKVFCAVKNFGAMNIGNKILLENAKDRLVTEL